MMTLFLEQRFEQRWVKVQSNFVTSDTDYGQKVGIQINNRPVGHAREDLVLSTLTY